MLKMTADTPSKYTLGYPKKISSVFCPEVHTFQNIPANKQTNTKNNADENVTSCFADLMPWLHVI